MLFFLFGLLQDFDTSQLFVLRADNPMTVNVEMSTIRVSLFTCNFKAPNLTDTSRGTTFPSDSLLYDLHKMELYL